MKVLGVNFFETQCSFMNIKQLCEILTGSVCLSIYVSVRLYMCVCLSIYVCLSLYICVCLSIYVSVCLYMSVCEGASSNSHEGYEYILGVCE